MTPAWSWDWFLFIYLLCILYTYIFIYYKWLWASYYNFSRKNETADETTCVISKLCHVQLKPQVNIAQDLCQCEHFYCISLFLRRVTTINQVTETGRFPPPSTGWVNAARHRAGCRSKASWIARGAGPWARSANTNNGGRCRSLRRDNGRAQQFKWTPRWQLCMEEINWLMAVL